ncbi:MAG TPA: type II secretion system F family protein [Planctomycetota bacterium]|nr:type II secretion system F family protein [Planctomycetota bacterium]
MPSFTFTARDSSGRTQEGKLSAASAVNIAGELRNRGWIVLDIRQDAQADEDGIRFNRLNPFNWLPATSLDVQLGFQQLASMLRSGLTLLTALKTASEQSRRPRMARIWKQVQRRIEEGSTFADALAEHKIFPQFTQQLVRVGEQTGALEVVLTRAAEHLQRMRDLRTTLLNALMYPAIVFVLALGVTAFLVIGVIPKMQNFVASSGRRLPAITQALIDVSMWTQAWLPYICIGIVAVIAALFALYRWPPARLRMDAFCLKIPVIGGLLRTSATAMFSRSLALLIGSGVTLLEALATVERLIGNRSLSRHVGSVRQQVIAGGSLAAPLSEPGTFTPMLARTVAVGEATGTLEPVLNEVAQFHESQLALTVKRLSVLVEPAVIIVVGGIVGFVYIAFFMALFSLAG